MRILADSVSIVASRNPPITSLPISTGAAPLLVLKLAIGGALLALIETLSAKMRIFRAPEFLGTAFLLAVLGMLVNQLLGS